MNAMRYVHAYEEMRDGNADPDVGYPETDHDASAATQTYDNVAP